MSLLIIDSQTVGLIGLKPCRLKHLRVAEGAY
jgi:hypothetical protein